MAVVALAAGGVVKVQVAGVEQQAFGALLAVVVGVEIAAEDRVADRLAVDAQLMGAAGGGGKAHPAALRLL